MSINRMLISAAAKEEGLRVALIRDSVLYDLDIEKFGSEQKKANIYKGRIEHIEPSLEAAFVNYGADRHGFLPIKEINRSYFHAGASEGLANPQIRDVLHEGQELLVQIDKEERGTKGAALTTFISLAGSYLVLMPNNPRAGGISRRIEGQGRDELRETLSQLNLPENMGVIVRTAGVGKALEELQWDLSVLLRLWDSIAKAAEGCAAPCLIYQEGDVLIRSIRDYLRQEIGEIIVDDPDVFERTRKYINEVRPEFFERVKLYQNKTPLFSSFRIEHQIESAYQRVLRLPSGGSIVIDHTEALVAIDVNSARATGGGDIEETALSTNLEAADEIARQLRLRDIGGLIVIDFIDMTPLRNQREVSDRMREALKFDRARVQVGNITRFGLLEMSRQRLRTSLRESVRINCPRCDGQGSIRSIESLATSVLHIIEEEASRENTSEIQAQLPIDLATFLLNEKRSRLTEIESAQEVRVLLLPNATLETPNYKIKRLRKNEGPARTDSSYKMLDERVEAKMPEVRETVTNKVKEEIPAVRSAEFASRPAPRPTKDKEISKKIKSLFGKIFGAEKSEAGASQPTPTIPSADGYPEKRRYEQRGGRNSRRSSYHRDSNSRSGERSGRPPQRSNNRRPPQQRSSTMKRHGTIQPYRPNPNLNHEEVAMPVNAPAAPPSSSPPPVHHHVEAPMPVNQPMETRQDTTGSQDN